MSDYILFYLLPRYCLKNRLNLCTLVSIILLSILLFNSLDRRIDMLFSSGKLFSIYVSNSFRSSSGVSEDLIPLIKTLSIARFQMSNIFYLHSTGLYLFDYYFYLVLCINKIFSCFYIFLIKNSYLFPNTFFNI